MLQSAAAGDLHADNGHAFYIIAPDDLGELFGIVHAVELRAAHKGDVSLDKPLVKGGTGIRRAVRGDEQLGPIENGARTGTSLICTGHWERRLCAADGAGSAAGAASCRKVLIRVPGQPP